MRISRHHRGLVVTAVGALLLVLGIALAVASKPQTKKARPKAKTPDAKVTLDCKVLEQQLSKCGPAIAAAFDSGLGPRLAKQSALLRSAVLRTISQEFVARVAGPCFMRKGRLDQGAALQFCLTAAERKGKATPCPGGKGAGASAKCRTARQLERCRAFAKCLAVKVRALPRPKKKAAPAMKAPPAMRPAPGKK